MAIKDVERFKRNPTSGADAGNQAVTDANIKALDRIAIPANETNTFNGGKVENGVINLSRNSDGDLVFQSYADGVWTEYLAVLDGLKSIGGITLDEDEVTVVAPVKWRINSVNYEKLVNTVITVNSATDGFKRIDYIYADTNNNILLIEGTEVADGNPYIPPILPANTIMIAPVYISGDTVQQPLPDLSLYITKSQGDEWYIHANPDEPQNAFIKLVGSLATDVTRHTSNGMSFEYNGTEQAIVGFSNNTIRIKGDTIRIGTYPNPDIIFINGDGITNSIKLTGSDLFEVTDTKDYVQAGYITLQIAADGGNTITQHVSIGSDLDPVEVLDVNGAMKVRKSTLVNDVSAASFDYRVDISRARFLSFGPDNVTYGGFQFINLTSSGVNIVPLEITSSGNVVLKSLEGVGDRPVSTAADGTLKIGTVVIPTLQQVATAGNTFTGDITVANLIVGSVQASSFLSGTLLKLTTAPGAPTGVYTFLVYDTNDNIVKSIAPDTLQSVVTRGSGVTGKIQVGTAPTNPTDVVRLTDLTPYARRDLNEAWTGSPQFGANITVLGTATIITLAGTSGAFSGNLTVNTAPTLANHVVRKTDLDSAVAAGIGVTVNSSAGTLTLADRGYYNYTGAANTIWSLPSSPAVGLFYRIYNQSSAIGTVTVNAAGSDTFYQGGTISSAIILTVGENLTIQWSGIYWSVYGS